MKKILWGVFLILLILAACSDETNSNSANSNIDLNETSEKNHEDEYINGAIESSVELQKSVTELKALFDTMEVTDPSWNLEVNRFATQIQLAANSYTLNANSLEDEQDLKYENTKKYYSEGVGQFHAIYSDIKDALKTYDKKKLQDVQSRLDPAMELVNEGIEQLEVERYE